MIDLSKKSIIEYRKAVIFLLILGLLGLFSYQNLSKQTSPTDKEATIKVYYPGASAQEVEKLVTSKIEEEIMSVDGYASSSSVSQRDSALIYLKLNDESKIEDKWQQVRDRLNNLQDNLPQNVQISVNTKLVETADILLSIWNQDQKYGQLIEDAKYIKGKLISIPGISSLEVIGEQVQEIKVQIDQNKLSRYKDISSKDLVKVLGMSNIATHQGTINVNGVQVSLNTSKALNSLEDIANTIIYISQESGGTVRLKDVANITWGPKDTNGIVKHKGENAVLLAGHFKTDKDIVALGQEIESQLVAIKANLSSQTKIEKIFPQSRDKFTVVNLQTETGLTLKEKKNMAEKVSHILAEQQGIEFSTVLIDQEGLGLAWVETDKFHQPAIQIRIVGPEEDLAKIVEETQELFKKTPGISSIQDDQSINRYEYFLDIDYQKAAFLGLNPLDIRETINLFSRGQIATTVFLEDQEYDINVEGNLTSIEDIMELSIISAKKGQRVLLKEIAELKLQPQVQLIRKYNGQHTVTVSAELQEGSSLREVERLVNNELAARDLKNFQVHFIEKGQARTIPFFN